MTDFFAFRTMIASRFIQVVFALGLAGIVVMFLGAAANDRALLGLLLLVFGALYWRVLCEVFIVFFRMNDTLRAIKEDTAALAPALATVGLAPELQAGGTDEPTLRDPTGAIGAANRGA